MVPVSDELSRYPGKKHVSSTARPSGAKAIGRSLFIAITYIVVAWLALISGRLPDEDVMDIVVIVVSIPVIASIN